MKRTETRLNEYDKTEWFAVARALKPGLSREEYENMWERFAAYKAQYLKNKALH